MTLAEHLSDEQRGIFIKKMLNALLYQVEGVERTSDEERKMLSASSIELALKSINYQSTSNWLFTMIII